MLRTLMFVCAATAALGLSAASAAPINAPAIAGAAYENAPLQQVWWGGLRHHHHRQFYRHHHRRGW